MERFKLTKVIEGKDEIDQEIISSTINMIAGLKIGNFILDKKSDEQHFGHVLEITQSLLKANSHRRRYIEEEKNILQKFKDDCAKDKNTADLGFNPIELNNEIEAVFDQIKSALDYLAKSFNPILELKLDGWHKKGKESGKQIITILQKNTKKELKSNLEQLIKYIQINIPWLSYVVWLRDEGRHRGGIKNITDIEFLQNNKEVIPQKIIHDKDNNENVSDFLTRLIKEITQFINGCIMISILVKAPGGMGIKKNDNNSWPPYSWFIFTNPPASNNTEQPKL